MQAWIDGEWKDVATFTNEPDTPDGDYKAFLETTEFSFGAVTTQRIRVVQPSGMGCADRFGDPVRQNIMWGKRSRNFWMTGNRSFPHVQFGGKERGSLIKENTMKRIHRTVALAISGFLALAFVAGCGYEPDYGYTAIDPGELPEPAVSRDDPSFRDYYPTLEPYDEPVTVTVAAIEYALEADVKPGTTPENQAFNEIAKKYLNIDLEYTVVAASSVYDQKLSLAIASKIHRICFIRRRPHCSLPCGIREVSRI